MLEREKYGRYLVSGPLIPRWYIPAKDWSSHMKKMYGQSNNKGRNSESFVQEWLREIERSRNSSIKMENIKPREKYAIQLLESKDSPVSSVSTLKSVDLTPSAMRRKVSSYFATEESPSKRKSGALLKPS